jgi:hypothetical protein
MSKAAEACEQCDRIIEACSELPDEAVATCGGSSNGRTPIHVT